MPRTVAADASTLADSEDPPHASPWLLHPATGGTSSHNGSEEGTATVGDRGLGEIMRPGVDAKMLGG